MSSYRQLLVAIDLSDQSRAIAAKSVELARLWQAQLRMLHVIEFVPVEPMSDALVPVVQIDDKVVARATGQGTHLGEYMGIPLTGRRIKVSWIAIYRIADGKLAEHWQQIDELGLRQQLGVTLTLPAS